MTAPVQFHVCKAVDYSSRFDYPSTSNTRTAADDYIHRHPTCHISLKDFAMRGWGIFFIIIGIGAFLLPYLGVQFILVSIFGAGNETIAGIFYIVLGVGMVVWGTINRGKT